MAIRCLLIDDHRLVREALRDALGREPDIEVVGGAADASDPFECTRSLVPDVVLLDIGSPDLGAIEAANSLKKRTGVDAKVVALSAHTDRRFDIEMLLAGAAAYVAKWSPMTELVRAIRAAAAGQNYLCPEVADSLVMAVRDDADGGAAPESAGTRCAAARRGRRALTCDRRPAAYFHRVEVHRRNIMRKLGLRTVAELTRYAVREGLIAP